MCYLKLTFIPSIKSYEFFLLKKKLVSKLLYWLVYYKLR